jgi:hypothetical protein
MHTLELRLRTLERAIRVQRLFIAALAIIAVAAAVMPLVHAQATPETVRTRHLIVEDEAGRTRIQLGAPLPGSGAHTGMRITDTKGFERLGLNLFDDGRMVVGIDGPPPASGAVSNLERINLVADSDGGAYIVFKNRKTSVVSRWSLDDRDQAWLEFSDFTRVPAARRRLGLAGDERPR